LDVDVGSRPRRQRRGDVTTTLAPTTPLTAADRCDRCGAQAYLRVVLVSGGELMFCAHHGKRYADGIRAVAAEIHDESSRLRDVPNTASDED
jgi:hypothetical protein